MIQCSEVTQQTKAERRSGSLKIRISSCVYISAVFDSFPHSTISYISGNKRKEKRQIIFLYVSVVVVFPYIQYIQDIYHHNHHVMPPARISLTLSHHVSQSFIVSGRFSGLHPVSSQSCCYVRSSWSSCFCLTI